MLEQSRQERHLIGHDEACFFGEKQPLQAGTGRLELGKATISG